MSSLAGVGRGGLHPSGSVLSWDDSIRQRTISLKLHPPGSPPTPWPSFSVSVMVNGICQPHGAIRAPRCLVKHYPEYVWEGVSGGDEHLTKQSSSASLMWVGLVQSVEGLKRRKRLTFPRVKGDFLLPASL